MLSMKKRIQGIVIGLILAFSLQGVVAYAATGYQAVKVFYNNIKICIDGTQITPKDSNGKTVEPFTLNGTTYLPVRAIANALGKEVDWDGNTATVYIGEKTSVDLDQLGSYHFESASGKSTYGSCVDGYQLNSDVPGANFTRGIRYVMSGGGSGSTLVSPEIVNDEYLLNQEYSRFTGAFYCWRQNGGTMSVLEIYGDGKLLYKSPSIADSKSAPAYFDVDVSGVSVLKLTFSTWDENQIDKTLIIGDGKLLK